VDQYLGWESGESTNGSHLFNSLASGCDFVFEPGGDFTKKTIQKFQTRRKTTRPRYKSETFPFFVTVDVSVYEIVVSNGIASTRSAGVSFCNEKRKRTENPPPPVILPAT